MLPVYRCRYIVDDSLSVRNRFAPCLPLSSIKSSVRARTVPVRKYSNTMDTNSNKHNHKLSLVADVVSRPTVPTDSSLR